MLTYLRYALAAVCFAASVGCLALLGWSKSSAVVHQACYDLSSKTIVCESNGGIAIASINTRSQTVPRQQGWYVRTFDIEGDYWNALGVDKTRFRMPELFGTVESGCYFPLWYPALIFTLAGVGVLRVSRQFLIRSALVVVSVVAALLGMAVVL